MKISEFDYDLPEELIAQTPLQKRDTSRLMVLDRKTKTIEDKHFYDILDYLHAGDILVRNNTKVIPARLYGIKEETGGHVEVLLLKDLGEDVWECLVGKCTYCENGYCHYFWRWFFKKPNVYILEKKVFVIFK